MSLAGLAQGAIVNLAARSSAVLLGVVLLVVVARLGPAVQGAYALFVAIESVLLTLFSGFGLALARRISHHGDDPAAPLRRWLRVSALTGSAAAVVLALVSMAAARSPYTQLWLLALAAPALLWVPTASGLWLGRGQMGRLNVPSLLQPLLMLAGLGLAAGFGHAAGWATVLAAWLAARLTVAAAAAAWALREAPAGADAPPGVLRGEWRFVAGVGLTNVLSVLNYRVPLFIVERSQGLAATGVYAVAVQVAELLWLLSSALSISAYRRIGEPDRLRAAQTTLQAARIGIVVALLAAPLLWLLAWLLLPRVLGPGYEGAGRPLALLLPGVAAYAGASALSAFFTNQLGRPDWAGRVAALSLLLNAVGCLWAVPRYGIDGAAASTSLSYLLAIGVALLAFTRELGWPLRVWWAGPGAVAAAGPHRQSPP